MKPKIKITINDISKINALQARLRALGSDDELQITMEEIALLDRALSELVEAYARKLRHEY